MMRMAGVKGKTRKYKETEVVLLRVYSVATDELISPRTVVTQCVFTLW